VKFAHLEHPSGRHGDNRGEGIEARQMPCLGSLRPEYRSGIIPEATQSQKDAIMAQMDLVAFGEAPCADIVPYGGEPRSGGGSGGGGGCTDPVWPPLPRIDILDEAEPSSMAAATPTRLTVPRMVGNPFAAMLRPDFFGARRPPVEKSPETPGDDDLDSLLRDAPMTAPLPAASVTKGVATKRHTSTNVSGAGKTSVKKNRSRRAVRRR